MFMRFEKYSWFKKVNSWILVKIHDIQKDVHKLQKNHGFKKYVHVFIMLFFRVILAKMYWT